MKKLFLIFLAVMTIISVLSVSAFAEDDIILGDVNKDGKISLTDCTIISQYIARWELGDGINIEAADVNRDDKVNLHDLAMVIRHIVNQPLDGPYGKDQLF